MNNSTLYPDVPTAPPMNTGEFDYSPNQSQIKIIIQESPTTCGQENTCSNCCHQNQECTENSKTKDIRKHPVVKIAWRTYMAFVVFLLGICLLTLPFFIYSIIKPKDGAYWIN